MKKKLLLGFSTLLLIFIIGGIIVVTDFSKIRENHQLLSLQEAAISRYEHVALESLDAIGKILQYQLGVNRDLEPLIKTMEKLDQDIDFLGEKYYSQYQNVCVRCHTAEKAEALYLLEESFSDVKQIIQLYKLKTSMIITSPNESFKKKLEGEILQYVETVTATIENLTGRIQRMKKHLKGNNAALISHSEITLAVTFLGGSLLSFLVIVFIYRSLTRPINTLIRGTEGIANGDYSQKISYSSRDEIGVLAERFNHMSSSLSERDQALKDSYGQLEKTNAILQASKAELEKYREELERKVEERTQKLKEMQKQFVRCETLSAVGKMASNISHELSSPLGTILGFTQIMLEELDRLDPKRKDLENIEREALRCEKILRGLLGFAKAPSALTTKININSLLKEISEVMVYQPALKNITLRQHLQGDLPHVEGDPEQLKQVFLNIIMNAVQAMGNGGDLLVSTRHMLSTQHTCGADQMPDAGCSVLDKGFNPSEPLGLSIQHPVSSIQHLQEKEIPMLSSNECSNPGETEGAGLVYQTKDNGCIHISFSDTGCGIHPSQLDRIFEPFFTTKSPEQGTGLGLSISYSIIEQFGGTITVQSRLNQGSTFTIVLPV